MDFWRHSNGTQSLTHSIFINLFIKVRLNTLLLPPLLSIIFVPSAFYACVWNILEGIETISTQSSSAHVEERDQELSGTLEQTQTQTQTDYS